MQNSRTNNITDCLGNIYEGELKDGMLHGRGKIKLKDGTIKEGEFKNDKLNGKCKITHSDGSVEECQFKDNIRRPKLDTSALSLTDSLHNCPTTLR